jgi:hypothetical protein
MVRGGIETASFDQRRPGVLGVAMSSDIRAMQGIQIESFDVESLRLRLRKMNDPELLSFGQAAKFMCSPRANLGKPPREEFVIQLHEARAEWRRRFPKIPLSESV